MKILDGVLESDHTFCVLYELDEADDWRDEATWIKALPMIGITPTLEYVRRYRDDAIATPGMQGEFETKCCNRWLHSAATWLSMAKWNACADAALRIEDFAGERALDRRGPRRARRHRRGRDRVSARRDHRACSSEAICRRMSSWTAHERCRSIAPG